MMPPGGGPMAMPGNLASPGARIVGGLIDVVILIVINGVVGSTIQVESGTKITGLPLIGKLAVDIVFLAADTFYFAYMWSSQGASFGMRPFGFKVRDLATGQYPTMRKAALRGFIWVLEVFFTVCLFGAIGWLRQLWDPQKQALHDKIAGTIVTTS